MKLYQDRLDAGRSSATQPITRKMPHITPPTQASLPLLYLNTFKVYEM
ncbi:hypothetical protein SAMN03003324_00881 [Pedobacter antarcticus]|uniref:Uncharacterized protein n=1 Tax=Pedobacter antarcticus TaxID=34086 RepID=A0A1I2BI60_9SPHI|nr:hypothetical protein SAMN03003324_00881 [Pedobacter antarcticus]